MLTTVAPARPNGAALLLMPGGGYARVAIGRGGSGLSRLFAAQGITVFELLYRLPHDGWAGRAAAGCATGDAADPIAGGAARA